ncbi:MAG: BBP7 family outer membrane beta-barrel protein [Gemmataceae bacterium]
MSIGLRRGIGVMLAGVCLTGSPSPAWAQSSTETSAAPSASRSSFWSKQPAGPARSPQAVPRREVPSSPTRPPQGFPLLISIPNEEGNAFSPALNQAESATNASNGNNAEVRQVNFTFADSETEGAPPVPTNAKDDHAAARAEDTPYPRFLPTWHGDDDEDEEQHWWDPRCWPKAHFWARVDYLAWWFRKTPIPVPLITTSPDDNNSFGILDRPGTEVIQGIFPVSYNTISSGRLYAGMTNSSGTWGLEGNVLRTAGHSRDFVFSSNAEGSPVLARPFTNAITDGQTAILVAFPTAFAGTAAVSYSPQLWGGEANLFCCLCTKCNFGLDAFVGYRYLELGEAIDIFQRTDVLPNGQSVINGMILNPPATVTVTDRFETRNHFHGGQIGLNSELRYKMFFLLTTAQVAVGNLKQVVILDGTSAAQVPNMDPIVVQGGLYAVGTNIGRTTQNSISFLPEARVSFGVQVTEWLRVYAGYDFLYVFNVARPGDQINTTVDLRNIPISPVFDPNAGGTEPTRLPITKTDFWAHGINFGLAVRY